MRCFTARIITGVFIFILVQGLAGAQLSPQTNPPAGLHSMIRVVDNRTIELDNGKQIQLAGVLVPDLTDRRFNEQEAKRLRVDPKRFQECAEGAKYYLEQEIRGGVFRLVYDQEAPAEEGSSAYLFIQSSIPNDLAIEKMSVTSEDVVLINGKKNKEFFLNAMLIRSGLGYVAPQVASEFKDEFERFEREAKQDKRGIWR